MKNPAKVALTPLHVLRHFCIAATLLVSYNTLYERKT